MLEKPDISDELIIASLGDEYDLHIARFTFLPIGADLNTAVYRVVTENGMAYFLKLRRGFEEITVTVPLLLKSQGIQEIIAPIETKSKRDWADFGEHKIILYPFIDGKDGFEMEFSDHHRQSLGTALKKIHSVKIPSNLKRRIPQENFSSRWRERLKSLQVQVQNKIFDDPTADKLAKFMKFKQGKINQLTERAEKLASELRSQTTEFVLCHSDIHGGNILISNNNLYIVDWDNPILAPKERDLMFIGGGIDQIWKTKHEEDIFYKGYGITKINLYLLAYYRYERIIEDLAVIGEQILLNDKGGADRERSLDWFTSNFEPGQTIEIAENTDIFLS